MGCTNYLTENTWLYILNLAQRIGTYSLSPSKTSRSSLSIAVSAYAYAFLGPIAVPFICLKASFSNSVILFSKVISRASIMQSVEKMGSFLLSKCFLHCASPTSFDILGNMASMSSDACILLCIYHCTIYNLILYITESTLCSTPD